MLRSALALSAASLLLGAAVAQAQPVNVKLDSALTDKFPCLERVLTNVRVTFDRPALWGKLWNQQVPKTGVFTNYTLAQMAPEFVRYLTDGQLRMKLVVAKRDVPAAETVSRNEMNLHQSAGLWMPAREYSDYGLAVTVAHELVRVWQFDKQWFPTLYPSKNEPAYYIAENNLPKDLFDQQRIPDPGGTTPVPPTCVAVARPTLATVTLEIIGGPTGSTSLALPDKPRMLTAADRTYTGPVRDEVLDGKLVWSPAQRAAVDYKSDRLPPVPAKATLTLNQPMPYGWSAALYRGLTTGAEPPLCELKRGETSCSVSVQAKNYDSFKARVIMGPPLGPIEPNVSLY